MLIQFKTDFDIGVKEKFALPDGFIENHLVFAPPAYVVIYIYSLKLAYEENGETSYKQIASKINGILEGDVENSFLYWQDKNIIKINYNQDVTTIYFLPIASTISTNKNTENNVNKSKVLIDSKPVYSMEELEFYKTNHKDVEKLFIAYERAFGKFLSSNDLNTIFAMYDWLRLPVEVIEYLLQYCMENDHINIYYIEKVAMDWSDKKIATKNQAIAYVNEHNSIESKILKAMGIKGRSLTTIELNFISKWSEVYDFADEIILEACDKTIMQASRPTIKYVDKILTSWNESNVKTLEDVEKLENEFRQAEKSKNISTSGVKKKSKNKFANFSQKSLDFERLEKLAQEKLINSGKDE